MSHQTEPLEHASVRQYCKLVRAPAIAANFAALAEQAIKEKHSHVRYLEALLAMECEERDHHAVSNRIRDAQLPRLKTLDEFDFEKAPQIPAAKIRDLAQGGYIGRSEPIVLIGDCGTGKTHLATGLCLAACQQKQRIRFITAAALVNELFEAKQNGQVKRMMTRYDLIALDEVGYAPLADIGAEFLFQVISDRAERAALIITTNLPFSEWTSVFPNPRLCEALLDRITAPTSSRPVANVPFKRMMERRKRNFTSCGRLAASLPKKPKSGTSTRDRRQVFFPSATFIVPFLEGKSIGAVVRWECGKRISVFQGLWKAVLAFHQSVISIRCLVV